MKKKQFSSNQIYSILKEFDNGRSIDELVRSYCISRATLYNWRKKYGGMEASEMKKVKELEAENTRLNRMYANLAMELGHQACNMGYKTIYAITARLLKKFMLCKADGTYLKELQKLAKCDLLILDDFGLQAFDNHARETLMDIIDDRYNNTSTIIASQIPVSAWYDIIGEGTIADAILDRIVNSSHRISLDGQSLRKGTLKKEN
ncbi:ATP-binding protein [Elizabethkingia anophelis]|uniref:ATP-binding protein n=1 Tax=Elizabethkingia anophelis TaxID=1117645 RepID=UPI00378703FA